MQSLFARRSTPALALGLALCAAIPLGVSSCGGQSAEPETFIALQRDFAPYASWHRVDLGDAPVAGHPAGHRYGFVNNPTSPGQTTYPVGSIIVKEIHVGDTPDTYDLFAMVKRGGTYNAMGAVGWEYFHLRLDTDNVTPVIIARGINPQGNDPYAITGTDGCNGCHAAAGTEDHDHLLSPLLQPGAAQ